MLYRLMTSRSVGKIESVRTYLWPNGFWRSIAQKNGNNILRSLALLHEAQNFSFKIFTPETVWRQFKDRYLACNSNSGPYVTTPRCRYNESDHFGLITFHWIVAKDMSCGEQFFEFFVLWISVLVKNRRKYFWNRNLTVKRPGYDEASWFAKTGVILQKRFWCF